MVALELTSLITSSKIHKLPRSFDFSRRDNQVFRKTFDKLTLTWGPNFFDNFKKIWLFNTMNPNQFFRRMGTQFFMTS